MSEEEKTQVPRVIDHLADAPYEMKINVPAVDAFLRGLHISKKTRRELILELDRECADGNTDYDHRKGGDYYHPIRRLRMFGEATYRDLNELSQIVRDREALGLTEGGFAKEYMRRHEKDLPENAEEIYRDSAVPVFRFLNTPRFIDYLKHADAARVDKFLQRQENMAMDYITKSAFFHELGHLVQGNRNDKRLATLCNAVIGLGVIALSGALQLVTKQMNNAVTFISSILAIVAGVSESGLMMKYIFTKPESSLIEKRESEAIAFSKKMMKVYRGSELITAKLK